MAVLTGPVVLRGLSAGPVSAALSPAPDIPAGGRRVWPPLSAIPPEMLADTVERRPVWPTLSAAVPAPAAAVRHPVPPVRAPARPAAGPHRPSQPGTGFALGVVLATHAAALALLGWIEVGGTLGVSDRPSPAISVNLVPTEIVSEQDNRSGPTTSNAVAAPTQAEAPAAAQPPEETTVTPASPQTTAADFHPESEPAAPSPPEAAQPESTPPATIIPTALDSPIEAAASAPEPPRTASEVPPLPPTVPRPARRPVPPVVAPPPSQISSDPLPQRSVTANPARRVPTPGAPVSGPSTAEPAATAPASVATPSPSGAQGSAASAGPVSASQGSILAYGARIRAQVAQHRPRGIRQSGIAVITLAVAPDGSLQSAFVSQTSGTPELDHAALAAVRAAAPFPPAPPGAAPDQLAFAIPFEFQ